MGEVTKLSVRRGAETRNTPVARILPTRIARPNNPKKALNEASRLYRDARLGHIPTEEASRLAYVLKTVGEHVERADLEPRIAAIEERVAALAAKLLV
jgi:hypothetical protein